MAGTLYLCATPIGNLEDMTFRAVRMLREVDLIAAEDTRNSIKLLNHFEIKTPMTSYHEFNKYDKAKVLVEKLLAGMNIALITDAGTPGISDPGEVLVRQCHEAGVPVTALPGACAFVNAWILSGLPTRRVVFEAFLPSDRREREEVLESLKQETRTIVIYEAPHRLVKTLQLLLETLGDRQMTVCRELTKKHETVFCTTCAEAVAYYTEHQPKGECVLVIAGQDVRAKKEASQQAWKELPLEAHMEYYTKQGMDRKAAMKQVAADRGVGKRDIYKQLLEESASN